MNQESNHHLCFIPNAETDMPLKERLTPMFISIVPQSTNMVEFPFLAIVMIWTIRMIEQTVVKRPSAKMPIRPIFRRKLIRTFIRRGMGMRKMTMSQKIVIDART